MPVYADHAATTPLDPRALEAMLPFLKDQFGNPSSLHAWGRRARMALDEARETIAAALGAHPQEIFFTSSGTESANLALLGTALANRGGDRKRILLASVEHHCVLKCADRLREWGFQVELLPCTRDGETTVETLAERLDDRTLLVSVMHANNEVGTMNDVRNIGRLCREAGAIYHCDAVQTFSVLPLEDAPQWADLLSVSAHKIYGPKGAGALFVRAGVRLEPLLLGGGQERELRAGTENVAGIVGFAAATELALADSDRWRRTRAVRDHFVGSMETNPQIRFTVTSWEKVLPGHAHLRIPGRKAETVLIQLDRRGIAASSGAACSSGSVEPSHVLMAMGFSEQEAAEGIRFSFGKDSTREDAEAIVRALFEICGA